MRGRSAEGQKRRDLQRVQIGGGGSRRPGKCRGRGAEGPSDYTTHPFFWGGWGQQKDETPPSNHPKESPWKGLRDASKDARGMRLQEAVPPPPGEGLRESQGEGTRSAEAEGTEETDAGSGSDIGQRRLGTEESYGSRRGGQETVCVCQGRQIEPKRQAMGN